MKGAGGGPWVRRWGAEPRPVVDAGHENIIQVYDIMTVPPETVDFRDVYIVTNLMVGARCHRLTLAAAIPQQHHLLHPACQAQTVPWLRVGLGSASTTLHHPCAVINR